MKRLSLYLFLILFTLQTPSLADDIRDFQIEGISIGDSLLDYMSEEEIKEIQRKPANKKIKYWRISYRKNLKTYDAVQIWWDGKDKNYKIASLGGIIEFDNDMNNCKKKQNEITIDIQNSIKNLRLNKQTGQLSQDKDGNFYQSALIFENGDIINIQCYEFSKPYKNKHNYVDNLKVMIVPKKFDDHYQEAYK